MVLSWARYYQDILSSIGTVVHEKKLDIPRVVNEESLVAGGHHVARLLVVAVTDLYPNQSVLYRLCLNP